MLIESVNGVVIIHFVIIENVVTSIINLALPLHRNGVYIIILWGVLIVCISCGAS